MHYIYLYTRISDGMQYVGQVLKRRETKREQEHRRNKNDTYFDRAYSKNPDDFLYAIIDEAKNQDQANEKEIYWIAELKTKFPDGFNLTAGGNGHNGYSPTIETRIKISEANKGQPAWNKGLKIGTSGMQGKKHSQESRAKQSQSHKGSNNYKSKPCCCIELNMIFQSVNMAAEWLRSNGWPKAGNQNIAACCREFRDTAYGYHWKYI